MTLNATEVDRDIAILDAADGRGEEWRRPLATLKDDLTRARSWRTWARRGAVILTVAAVVFLHGARWDVSDMILLVVLLPALEGLIGLLLHRLTPVLGRADRIDGLVAYFEGRGAHAKGAATP